MNDRIKVEVYNESGERVEFFDTYVEDSGSFEMAEMEWGTMVRRYNKAKEQFIIEEQTA